MKLKLKAILLLTMLLAGDVMASSCAIEESNVDFDNLRKCVGGYPHKFADKIIMMSKAHVELQTSTDFFVEGVQTLLKDLSYKLTTVS